MSLCTVVLVIFKFLALEALQKCITNKNESENLLTALSVDVISCFDVICVKSLRRNVFTVFYSQN